MQGWVTKHSIDFRGGGEEGGWEEKEEGMGLIVGA